MVDETFSGFLLTMLGFMLSMIGFRRSSRKRFAVISTVASVLCVASAVGFSILADLEQFYRIVFCGIGILSVAVCVFSWSNHFDRIKEMQSRW